MRAVHILRRVELRPVHLAGAGDIGGNTIEDKVVGNIGNEMNVGVAGEFLHLAVDQFAMRLQRDDIVIILIDFPLVQVCRICIICGIAQGGRP